ncbi:MAG: 50S ribosomal protein L7ae [Oscillospiraceae bacterium]|nr:50S ribosomal protein L7ae [Oscillospiraceae bacterium]
MGHNIYEQRLLSMLGICKKAGKLAEGFDPVEALAKQGGAKLILTANDISPRSERAAARAASQNAVAHEKLPVTMDDIHRRLGKRAGIFAIADEGLARAVQKAAGLLRQGGPVQNDNSELLPDAALKEENSLCQ